MLLALLDSWIESITQWKGTTCSCTAAPVAWSPTITITSPANSATVSGVFTIAGWTQIHHTWGTASAAITASFAFGVNSVIRNEGLTAFPVTNGFNTATIEVIIKNSSSTGSSGSTMNAFANFWGVNTHMAYPISVPSDNPVTPGAMLSRLLAMNVKMVRADIAGPGPASILAAAIVGFASAGIKVQPVFQVIGNGWNPETQNESQAYALGYSMAQACCSKLSASGITHYECGNELDAWKDATSLGFKIAGNGAVDTDWRQAYWPAYRGVARGMIQGVHDFDSTLLCGFGQGVPMAYRAMEMLWDGVEPNSSSGHPTVRWDYTCYHWYHSYGNIRAGAGTADILSKLYVKFAKPIWLTEVGFSGGEGDTSTSASASVYMRSAVSQYYSLRVQFQIESIQWYTLHDPSYGLISADGTTLNASYTTYKDYISAHQSLSS